MRLPFELTIPLCAFDLETTGTDVAKDRIVEIAIRKIMPDGEEIFKRMVVDPEMPIPKGASDVHGITDEVIQNLTLQNKAFAFRRIAKSVLAFIDNCDFLTYNGDNFDVPLLSEEFARCDIQWPDKGTRFIDSCSIFKKNEQRNLTAALKFFCGEEMENAHEAGADVDATVKILIGQIAKYPHLQGQSIDALVVEGKPDNEKVDLAGKMTMDKDGVIVFNFGKHYGQPVLDVFKNTPSYYSWLMGADFIQNTKNHFKQLFDSLNTQKKLF